MVSYATLSTTGPAHQPGKPAAFGAVLNPDGTVTPLYAHRAAASVLGSDFTELLNKGQATVQQGEDALARLGIQVPGAPQPKKVPAPPKAPTAPTPVAKKSNPLLWMVGGAAAVFGLAWAHKEGYVGGGRRGKRRR